MSRLAQGVGTGIVMEVARGERNVAFVGLDGAAVSVRRMEKREFDLTYSGEPADGTRVRSTPRHFARVWLKAPYWAKTDDAVRAMLNELALADDDHRNEFTVILAGISGKLIAAYESRADALIARAFYPGAHDVASPSDLGDWPAAMIEALRSQVAPGLKAKGRKLIEGVVAMAKAAKKPEAPAPVKAAEKVVKERKARADGPVAIVRAYVEANEAKLRSGALTKAQARAELLAKGVVGGTIGVQLPKWLKALGIEAVKGGMVRKDKETGAVSIVPPKPPKTSTLSAKGKAAPLEPAMPAKAKAKGKAAPAVKGKAAPAVKGKAKK